MALKLLNPPVEELNATMNIFREACRYISNQIQAGDRANRGSLHRKHYKKLRGKFKLPSQLAQSVIRVVVGAYRSLISKGDKFKHPTFCQPQAQFQYRRDWSFSKGRISLRTLNTRRKLDFLIGKHQRQKYLNNPNWKCGGARLIKRKNEFYFHITLKHQFHSKPRHQKVHTPVGIDRGIRILAAARIIGSPPLIISGGNLRNYRHRMMRLRDRLQAKGTRAARRVLRRLRGRAKRFVLDVCRCAAKKIVQFALQTSNPVLVFESLEGIRKRVRPFTRQSRRDLHTWSFRILLSAIRNLAEEFGIPVIFVNPAYTSQMCPRCKSISRSHRQQNNYFCKMCRYQNNADVVAATNIASLWFDSVKRIRPGVLSTTQTCHRFFQQGNDAQAAELIQ